MISNQVTAINKIHKTNRGIYQGSENEQKSLIKMTIYVLKWQKTFYVPMIKGESEIGRMIVQFEGDNSIGRKSFTLAL